MLLSINLEKLSYDIVIENGAILNVGRWLDLKRRVLIVTDDGVPEEYAQRVAKQCKNSVIYTIPQGETSKNLKYYSEILSQMVHHGFTRNDCVVAVGGGVVGDLSGFAASCYMRGIDFYNIPTTLLSQIDASIGGKTAINYEGIKNAVGSFYQPKKVIIDPKVLDTLDSRQVRAGLVEAIKMAATSDPELFEIIENSTRLADDLPEIIVRSLKIKRDVVENDPKENGLRKVLNFGHTTGHAIESYCRGEFLHGECIAMGMIPMCSNEVRLRLIKILKKYGLPTCFNGNVKKLHEAIMLDKKRQSGFVQAVFLDEIGKFRFVNMPPKEIMDRMEEAYEKQFRGKRSSNTVG